MLKLYGIPASQASRCLWALEELGVEYALERVRPYEDTQKPELLELNPNGKVPVLLDGELVLWESLAINLYLAQKFGAPLWPEDAIDRAHALQWSVWVGGEVEPHLWSMRMHRELLPANERIEARATEAETKLRGALELLDRHLASSPWVVGTAFSVADLNLESYIIRARRGGYDLAEHLHLHSWIERCEARPARKKVRAMIEADEAAS
jgi:glutathione S-transferase